MSEDLREFRQVTINAFERLLAEWKGLMDERMHALRELEEIISLMKKVEMMIRVYLKILRKEAFQDEKALLLMVGVHDSVVARCPDVARLMREVEEMVERTERYVA